MQRKNAYYKDCAIHYKVFGKGRPVVLLHGFAEDGDVWHYQVNFLKDYYQLIVPDIPGSGRSTLWQNDISMDTLAESIKAILDAEQITSCTIIGHSLGGYITLAMAEKYPALLNGFGLFHSSAFADSEEKKQARLKSIEFIKKNGSLAFVKSTTPGLFAGQFTKNHLKEINSLADNGKNFVEEVLIRYYEAMINRPDRTAVLSNFSKPILFIMGEHDKAVPLDISLKQCYLPSISYIFILKNSAHMGMWEEKGTANMILLDFLKAVTI